jgi:hypothetical protein
LYLYLVLQNGIGRGVGIAGHERPEKRTRKRSRKRRTGQTGGAGIARIRSFATFQARCTIQETLRP